MNPPDRSDRAAEIAVLLVDDDVEWVTTTGAALEAADDTLSVITATGGWEALDLLADEPIDCVVCDYRMPDFDGIALLERIRADHGDVPFILVTGSGSETVASRAISSRVTDYFIKDPERDQSRALTMRIRTAVEAHRNARALDAARQRFTALFENVPDPAAIASGDGAIRTVNDAFADVFGVGREDVEGSRLDDVVRGAGRETENRAGDPAVRLLAAETTAGEREFLVRRFPLGRSGSPEFGHVFTDITRQRERTRELERFHELSAEVRELLLSAESREELERSFCVTVAATIDGSTTMLVRGRDADDVTVRATAGEGDDRLERALFELPEDADSTAGDADSTSDDRHPVRAALATGESRYVADVADVTAEWAVAARSRDVRELLAVPIERGGVPTGAFVVCTTTSTLDETTRDRLDGLVSSLGDAIDLVDRVMALTADRVVRVRLSVADDGTLLNELARTTTAAIDVVSSIPREDSTALYVRLADDDVDDALSWLEASADVVDHEVIGDDGRSRVRIDATAWTVPTTLARRVVDIHSMRVEDGVTTVAFDVPPSDDVRATVEAVEETYDAVAVESIRTVERTGHGPEEASSLRELTDKQRRALETAFHEGYFDQPRAGSADEVAAALGISRSTFLQHLRVAERKLLADLFGWESSDREG